jgi:hypothetical protein
VPPPQRSISFAFLLPSVIESEQEPAFLTR